VDLDLVASGVGDVRLEAGAVLFDLRDGPAGDGGPGGGVICSAPSLPRREIDACTRRSPGTYVEIERGRGIEGWSSAAVCWLQPSGGSASTPTEPTLPGSLPLSGGPSSLMCPLSAADLRRPTSDRCSRSDTGRTPGEAPLGGCTQRITRSHGSRPYVALIVIVAIVGATMLSHPLTGALPATTTADWGWSAQTAADGHLIRVLTAIPLTRNPFMLTSMCLSLAVAVGGLELLAGHRRALATLVGGAVFGYAAITAAVFLLRQIGVGDPSWAMTVDYGASAGIAASAAAIAALLNVRTVTIGALVFILGGLVLHHQIADWEHLLSFSASFAITKRSSLAAGRSALDLPAPDPH